MIGDPATASRRTDLGFLTTRSRPRTTSASSAPDGSNSSAAASTPGSIDYVRRSPRASTSTSAGSIDYVRRTPRATPEPIQPPTIQPPAPEPLEHNPLDLSTPAAAPPIQPPAPEPLEHNPLDLSTPAPPAAPTIPSPASPPVVDDLLDLSGGLNSGAVGGPGPSVPAQSPAASNPVATQPPSIHPIRRLIGDDRELLTPARPTLALTRLQSGIGRIDIELHAPAGAPLALACVVTDADGESSVIDPTHPRGATPPSTTDPLITFSGNGFGSFGINLRRSRELARLIIVAASTTGQAIDWTGTLSISTFGGGRADIPIDATPHSSSTIIASIYNVDGEYVLRAEGQPMNGSLREASRSFGFDTISWLDARTPVA